MQQLRLAWDHLYGKWHLHRFCTSPRNLRQHLCPAPVYLDFLLYLECNIILGTRDQIANIHCIIKKSRKFQKNTYLCFIEYAKAFDCVDHNKLWKILQEMEIPGHLTCLLKNMYASKEATVRTRHGRMDWFKIGKAVCQGCILSPKQGVYLTSTQSTSCEMPDRMTHKLESRMPGEITSDRQVTPLLRRKVNFPPLDKVKVFVAQLCPPHGL